MTDPKITHTKVILPNTHPKVEFIRQIARELRDDRNRDPQYAMRAARRYVRRFGWPK